MNARLSYFLATLLASLAIVVSLITSLVQAQAVPNAWRADFPLNDFSNSIVSFDEIADGGPRRDGIPPIDNPQFVSLEQATARYTPQEPVISLLIGGEAKAYPLQILMWHEIVNDRIAGIPVAVTFCPLCNASLVFDARLEGRVLTFGTTGRLRNSDLIMYDRETGAAAAVHRRSAGRRAAWQPVDPNPARLRASSALLPVRRTARF